MLGVVPLMSSCDNPNPSLGVLLGDGGTVTIGYKPCANDALILSVKWADKDGALWEARSKQGSRLREFPVGSTPPGFDSTNNLTRTSPDGYRRVESATSELPSDSESFDVSDLRPGLVLVPRRGVMSLQEFQKRNTCD